MGFTLGVLFRNSAAAIVGYFVYAMVLPTLSALLAGAQGWYADAQPWVDFQWNQTGLFDGGYGPTEWAQLLVTGTIWLLLPLAFGLWRVLRRESRWRRAQERPGPRGAGPFRALAPRHGSSPPGGRRPH